MNKNLVLDKKAMAEAFTPILSTFEDLLLAGENGRYYFDHKDRNIPDMLNTLFNFHIDILFSGKELPDTIIFPFHGAPVDTDDATAFAEISVKYKSTTLLIYSLKDEYEPKLVAKHGIKMPFIENEELATFYKYKTHYVGYTPAAVVY